MPTEILAAFIGIYAVLQALSLMLTNLDVAAKQIDGRSRWVAPNGTVFEEFAAAELETSEVMKQDLAVVCAEAAEA
jgi:hypothetical protein